MPVVVAAGGGGGYPVTCSSRVAEEAHVVSRTLQMRLQKQQPSLRRRDVFD